MFFLPVLICSKKFLKQASGTFFTPNWPLTYHQNAACTWNFSIPSGREIRLFYTSFKLGGNPFCNKNRENEEDELRITGRCAIIGLFSETCFTALPV